MMTVEAAEVAQELTKARGLSVLVDNKPGGGNIAAYSSRIQGGTARPCG